MELRKRDYSKLLSKSCAGGKWADEIIEKNEAHGIFQWQNAILNLYNIHDNHFHNMANTPTHMPRTLTYIPIQIFRKKIPTIIAGRN